MKYKFSVTRHFETIEEVIKIAESYDENNDSYDYIAIVSVESLEEDCPFVVQMTVHIDEYKDVFRAIILTIMEDGGLYNAYGDAGEDELDPVETVDECVEFCIDKLEQLIDSWKEYYRDCEKEGDVADVK